MVTIIAILVTDLLLLVIFVNQYQQELGIAVNGYHDIPPRRRRRPPPPPAAPPPVPQITKR